MNKKLFWLAAAAVAITIVVAVTLNGDAKLSQDDAYEYSSRDKALIDGLAEITGHKLNTDEMMSWVIDSIIDGDKEYCLIAVPFEESGLQKHYSFVAVIEKNAGKYAFFKVTADVALNSPGAVPDKDNTDSLVFFFDDVEGYYICVGKVFRKDAVPFANNRRQEVNADGIFSFFDDEKRPDISIRIP